MSKCEIKERIEKIEMSEHCRACLERQDALRQARQTEHKIILGAVIVVFAVLLGVIITRVLAGQ